MKYKAIFLDLDGTTVAPFSSTPSNAIIQAVKKAHDVIRVCLATGRLIHQCEEIIKSLDLNGLCVVANGIQIYDPVSKNIVREIGLHTEDIPVIIKLFKKYKLNIRIFDGKNDIAYDDQYSGKSLSFFNPSVPVSIVEKLITDLSDTSDVVVHKLLSPDKGNLGLEVCHATATK